MRVIAFALAATASARSLLQTLSKGAAPIPAGNVASFSDNPVEHGLEVCQRMPNVGDETKPVMKVKGTSIRIEAYLYANCEGPASVDVAPVHVGACDTKKAPETEEVMSPQSPKAPAGLQFYKSYKVVKC